MNGKSKLGEESYIMKVIFLDIDGVFNSNFWRGICGGNHARF